MATTERREFRETKVSRTLSPQRTASAQSLDQNLDYLLEDLQSSVSRPGSSVGMHRSSGRLTHATPANPTTYADEHSYSYNSLDGNKAMKKQSYSYNYSSDKPGPEKMRMQKNIDQLDNLLDDLQHSQKTGSRSDLGSVTTREMSSKKTMEREYTLGSPELQNSSSYEVKYSTDGTYGDLRHGRAVSPGRTHKTAKVTNFKSSSSSLAEPVPIERTELVECVDAGINPEVLAQLDPKLLPSPNTKVTTTIKTYTYEIPGGAGSSDLDRSILYSSNASTPSKSFTYNKQENSSKTVTYPDGREYTSILKSPGTTRKTYGGSQPGSAYSTPVQSRKEYFYESKTTKNSEPIARNYQVNEFNEMSTRNVNTPYYSNGHAPGHDSSYSYRKETHSTSSYANPKSEVERVPPPPPPVERNVNISYKYTSEKTTSNQYGAGGDPYPKPFPVAENGGPPRKVDDLMATIGNEPPNSQYNSGYTAVEHDKLTQRKQNVVSNELQKEYPKSRNQAGPPVYYPPNHEMFTKKEESMSYGGAQGEKMKAKGKYKYEAKEKSKEKQSSGMMVAPVCLPLCCGLPCVIM